MKTVAKRKAKKTRSIPSSKLELVSPAAGTLHRSAVSVKERRLNFGHKWDYTPAPESVPVKIESRYELFIDGKFIAPHSGKYFPSVNPATEEKLSEIAAAD